jgi:hypothetical protein
MYSRLRLAGSGETGAKERTAASRSGVSGALAQGTSVELKVRIKAFSAPCYRPQYWRLSVAPKITQEATGQTCAEATESKFLWERGIELESTDTITNIANGICVKFQSPPNPLFHKFGVA